MVSERTRRFGPALEGLGQLVTAALTTTTAWCPSRGPVNVGNASRFPMTRPARTSKTTSCHGATVRATGEANGKFAGFALRSGSGLPELYEGEVSAQGRGATTRARSYGRATQARPLDLP